MSVSKYLAVLIVAAIMFGGYQLITAKVSGCKLSCKDDEVVDLKMCICVDKPADESAGDEIKTESSHRFRCEDNEMWNGSECIEICPPKHTWNGFTCRRRESIFNGSYFG